MEINHYYELDYVPDESKSTIHDIQNNLGIPLKLEFKENSNTGRFYTEDSSTQWLLMKRPTAHHAAFNGVQIKVNSKTNMHYVCYSAIVRGDTLKFYGQIAELLPEHTSDIN